MEVGGRAGEGPEDGGTTKATLPSAPTAPPPLLACDLLDAARLSLDVGVDLGKGGHALGAHKTVNLACQVVQPGRAGAAGRQGHGGGAVETRCQMGS